MFKRFYTTRMSTNGKNLQLRFHKMRAKNRRFSRLMAVAITAALLLGIACISLVMIAVDNGSTSPPWGMKENKLLTKLGYSKTFLTEVLDSRTTFSQNNEHINQIIESLPLQAYRRYSSCSIQAEPSKEINVVYEFDDNYDRGGNGIDPFYDMVEEDNALLLFITAEGLDKVNFLHYDNQELNRTVSYTMDDLTAHFGKTAFSDVGFSDLYRMLQENIRLSEFYFAHYSRIYLGTEPERVSYRIGEANEIRYQSDGSVVWIYPEFGHPYNISSDPLKMDYPGYIGMYYFNSPAAKTNDNLTGLYATRFIHADNYEKSYDEITELLGLPSIVKNLRGGYQYIAYPLDADGPNRNAYFILYHNKIVEEGVMYGNDYTMLKLE